MKAKLAILLTLALLLLVFAGCQSANSKLYDPNAQPAGGEQITGENLPDQVPAQANLPVEDTQPTTVPAVQEKMISAAEAKAIALTHATLKAADVTGLRAQKDTDDGVTHYDVEFRYGDHDYDYEIHAKTGKVLSYDKDYDPVRTHSTAPTQKPEAQTDRIGLDKAKQIALKHAGLTEDQVTGLHAEYDLDDGVSLYEVEFRQGGFEYSYEIHAESGKILQSEKDWDD